MNTRFENYMSMVVRVRDLLNMSADIMTPINRYTDSKDSFDSHITLAETTSMQQQSNTSGKAELKKQRRLELVAALMKVVTFLIAYATFENNPELLSQVSTNKSRLQKLPIHKFRAFAQEIHAAASELMTDLEAYGLESVHLDNLKAALEAFVLVMQTPQLGKGQKKQLTSQLTEIRGLLEDDLNKMDKLVDLVADTNPEYRAQYYNMRRIDDTGTSRVALTGKAVDADTGTGLKSVVFTFSQNGHSGKEAGTDMMKSVKRTSDKGGFMMKTLPEGTYECTVAYDGYITQVFNVYVHTGVLTRVNVELRPAA